MKTTRMPKFIKDFIAGLSNEPGGFSLKKLIAVGLFWVTSLVCIRYTDKDNLVLVITALLSTITALLGINSYFKNKQDPNNSTETPKTDQP